MRRFYEIYVKNSELPPNADRNGPLTAACTFFRSQLECPLEFSSLNSDQKPKTPVFGGSPRLDEDSRAVQASPPPASRNRGPGLADTILGRLADAILSINGEFLLRNGIKTLSGDRREELGLARLLRSGAGQSRSRPTRPHRKNDIDARRRAQRLLARRNAFPGAQVRLTSV